MTVPSAPIPQVFPGVVPYIPGTVEPGTFPIVTGTAPTIPPFTSDGGVILITPNVGVSPSISPPSWNHQL